MSVARGIAIGGSLGGAEALGRLLTVLPTPCLPIAVVLHRRVDSTKSLAALVARLSGRAVREVEDDTPLGSGVYLAPADYHLLIDGDRLRLSVDDEVQFARPSIDELFHSAAQSWGSAAAAVMLTAASDDGAEGIAAVAQRGGAVYVEDPATARSHRGPAAALAALAAGGFRPTVGTPEELGAALCEWLSRDRRMPSEGRSRNPERRDS